MHITARRAAALATSLSLALIGPSAQGSGLEIPDNGTVALGRGGAFVVRASDATVMIHNVAGIVGLPGLNIHIGSNFGLLHHCFQRDGVYPNENETNVINDGTVFAGSRYSAGNVRYPQICNNPNVSITPNIALTYRINRRVAVGLAAFGPNTSGTPQNFSDRYDLPGVGLAPSPARYLVYQKSLLLAYIVLAAAFAPVPWLRIGVSVQPAYATFTFGTMVNTLGSESPDTDAKVTLSAHGWLLAGQVGIQILPSPYLSFGAQVRMNPEVHLQGTGEVDARYYAQPPVRDHSEFSVDRMTVPLPWNLRAGARFSLPRRSGRTNVDPRYDPMVDDVFDLEAVFAYENTSRMSNVVLENSGGISVTGTAFPAPAIVRMDSAFRDTFGFRLGGDVNIVPGRLAVRAGMSYDTGAEGTAMAQIHLPGYETYTANAGASVRLGPITANLGYEHVFMGGLEAHDGQRVQTSVLPNTSCNNLDACAINRGVFSGHIDLFSVSLSARF